MSKPGASAADKVFELGCNAGESRILLATHEKEQGSGFKPT